LRGLVLLLGLWLVLVQVPIAFIAFDAVNGWLFITLGTIDYGGATQLGVCLGTLGLVLTIYSRVSRAPSAKAISASGASVAVAAAVGVVGWVALAAGSETTLDETTGPVIIITLLGAFAGAIGWGVAETIRVHTVRLDSARLSSLLAGMIAGVLVTLPVSPWLAPPAAVVIAIIAGILGSLSLAGLRRSGFGEWSLIVAVFLVPGLLGMILTGVVANGVGFIYSGQLGLTASQLVGSGIVIGYTMVVGALLAFIVDRIVGLFAATVEAE
jgi:ammonium transporter, Amt family